MSNLKKLVEVGFLVDEKAKELIEGLNEEDFEKLIESLKKDNPLMVSKSLVKNLFTKELKILSEFRPKRTVSIKDFVGFLNEKYIILQKILIEKIELKDAVSINKCSSGQATIIGMVRTIEERNNDMEVFVEDPTGEIKTVVSKKMGSRLVLDDVIAISGNVKNKIFFVDKLVFPDIPLRPVKYSQTPVKVGFVQDKESEADYVINDKQIKDNLKNKIYNINIPAIVEILDVNILVAGDYDPVEALNKRYIKKENNDFIINTIPDIVFSEKNIDKNYKGITIVSPNNIIDLKTREVNKIL